MARARLSAGPGWGIAPHRSLPEVHTRYCDDPPPLVPLCDPYTTPRNLKQCHPWCAKDLGESLCGHRCGHRCVHPNLYHKIAIAACPMPCMTMGSPKQISQPIARATASLCPHIPESPMWNPSPTNLNLVPSLSKQFT